MDEIEEMDETDVFKIFRFPKAEIRRMLCLNIVYDLLLHSEEAMEGVADGAVVKEDVVVTGCWSILAPHESG